MKPKKPFPRRCDRIKYIDQTAAMQYICDNFNISGEA